MSSIGERVRAARVEAGLSQTELAGEDLSPSYVSLIESGRRNPTAAVVARLAVRLGCAPAHLTEGARDQAAERARLRVALARRDVMEGRAGQARTDMTALLGDDVLSPALRRDATVVLGTAHEQAGELDAAVAALQPLHDEDLRSGRALPLVTVALPLSRCFARAGDLQRSIDVAEGSLRLAREQGLEGVDEYVELIGVLVGAYRDRGDLLYASQRAHGVIRSLETTRGSSGAWRLMWEAALVARHRGLLEDALALSARALAVGPTGSRGGDLARLRVDHAGILLSLDDPAVSEALDVLRAARVELESSGRSFDLAVCDEVLARAQLAAGQAREAAGRASDAQVQFDGRACVEAAQAGVVLGDALLALGDVDGGRSARAAAADMLRTLPPTRPVARLWRQLADRLAHDGAGSEAAEAYRRALDVVGVPGL